MFAQSSARRDSNVFLSATLLRSNGLARKLLSPSRSCLAAIPTLRILCECKKKNRGKPGVDLGYRLEFTSVNATSYKWTVNLPSSTGAVAFAITDNEGNEAYTDDVRLFCLTSCQVSHQPWRF